MGLEWKDVLSQRKATRGTRRAAPTRIAGAAAALVTAALLTWLAVGGRGAGTAVAAGGRDGADDAAGEAAKAAPAGVAIRLYPRETRLSGVELLGKGDFDGAEKWLLSYLSAPDGREDQALYALGMLYRSRGRPVEADDALSRLLSLRRDSLRAGDALYELALLREEAGRTAEARECLREAVTVYARSRGGSRAAARLADELYAKHVAGRPGARVRRSEWERVRDLYSIALRGMGDVAGGDARSADRDEVVARLDELNEWVVFTPYSRPKPGYASTVTFHQVKRGESLGGIAKRYGVSVGALRRLNRIPPARTIIRPGEELKILRGRCELFVKLSEFRLTAWIGGCFFREYEVGIGREGRTPTGVFKIATRVVEPPWYSPEGEVIAHGDERNILGSRWLGFERSGAGRGIGIHGSVEKDGVWQGVGEESSNGCIRMRDPDAEELFDFAVTGTEVTIVE